MLKLTFVRPLAILAVIGSAVISPSSTRGLLAADASPNVIFILCDDLGWGDLGVSHQNDSTHDKKFSTPHLDAMARGGAILRNHYCPAPVCAPSRASLLLGTHQGHCDVRDNQFDKELPDNHTLATVMKSAGYATALIGKYGLQGQTSDNKEASGGGPDQWPGYPTKRGFDEFLGYVRHVDGHVHYPAHEWPLGDSPNHRSPKEVWHNDQEISGKLDRCYTTDLFTAYAKHWIEKQTTIQKKPFFLYLAYDTPHAALQVPTSAYPDGGGLDGGLQWTGEEGRMINTARGEIDSYRYPEYTDRGWTDVEERFSTMVRRIDDCVGDLLQTLKELGIDDNTLVVFTSDNGPHQEAYLAKAHYDPASFQSYGPFDGIKRDTWEGGIRVPTLAWWPSKIPAGTVDASPSQFHDWMATMADVAGQPTPAVCDGVSLLPTITGTSDRRPSTVYVEYDQNGSTPKYEDFEKRKRGSPRKQMQVIMQDGYKGIRTDIKNAKSPFEIYDLQNDPGESKNLAGTDEAMKALQTKMQNRVLRLRRVNASAQRPYDNEPMPALDLTTEANKSPFEPGILVKTKVGKFQSVPNFDSLSSSNDSSPVVIVISRPNPQSYLDSQPARDAAYEFMGYLKIPTTGNMTFEFDSVTPAVVRVHEAILFDNDFNHQPGQSMKTSLSLEAGWHPFTITLVGAETEIPDMKALWNLSGRCESDPDTDVVAAGWVFPRSKSNR